MGFLAWRTILEIWYGHTADFCRQVGKYMGVIKSLEIDIDSLV